MDDDLIEPMLVTVEVPRKEESSFDEDWNSPDHGGVRGDVFTIPAQVEFRTFPLIVPQDGGADVACSGSLVFRAVDLRLISVAIKTRSRITSIVSSDGGVNLNLSELAIFISKLRPFGIQGCFYEASFGDNEPVFPSGVV